MYTLERLHRSLCNIRITGGVMFAVAEAFQEVIVRLSVLRYTVTAYTRRGKNDVATDAENFFAGLLNILFGWRLLNLNVVEGKNFPAIDLGDKHKRVAIQVTAESGIDKIRTTVDKFYEYELNEDYDILIILILSRKPDYFTAPASLTRGSLEIRAWDLDDILVAIERQVLMNELESLDNALITRIEQYTRRELPAIVRALSCNGRNDQRGLLAQLELVIGHPPTSAQRFLDWYNVSDPTEAAAALKEITAFHETLKNQSYVHGRQILWHAVVHALTKREYEDRFPGAFGSYLSDSELVFYPAPLAAAMPCKSRDTYWEALKGLQFAGWARPMDDIYFFSVGVYMRSLDTNFFYLLRQFLSNDVEKLHSVLIDLDFRHLD